MNDCRGQEIVVSSESQEDMLNVCRGQVEIVVSSESQEDMLNVCRGQVEIVVSSEL